MCNTLGLTQLVQEPTREDQIFDLAMTELDAICKTFPKLGTSDNNPVMMKLDVSSDRDKPYQRKVWCDKANFWEMRGFLASADWSLALHTDDPEEARYNVTTIISDAMKIYIPG